MTITRNFHTAAALLSLAGLALAAPAWALGPVPGDAIRIPVADDQPRGEAPVSRSQTIVTNEEGEFGISRENGKTTIKVHGKPITLDADGKWQDPDSDLRVERTGRRIVVYRGDKAVATMNENRFPSLGADAEWAWPDEADRFRGRAAPRAERLLGLLAEADAPRPPVMLGVTLSEVDEASAEAANVSEPEKATIINRVFKGLPADKAGLRDKDIIIQINGATNAAPDALREVLSTMRPGDTLNLKIVRDGVTNDIAVELSPYDPERMGAPRAYAWARGGDFFSDESLKRMEELRAEIAHSADTIRSLGARVAKNAGADAEAVESISKQMAELASKIGAQSAELARLSAEISATDIEQWIPRRAPGAQTGGGASGFGGPRALRFFNDNGAPRAVIVDPDAPTPPTPPTPPSSATSPVSPTPSAQTDDRIRQIDRRIERLEKLLERMIEERTRASRPDGSRDNDN